MSTEPVTTEPKFRPSAWTTYELNNRRRELEVAIKGISPDAPVQAELRRKLAEIVAEQDERQRIRHAKA